MNRTPLWLRSLLLLSLTVGCSGSGHRDAAITESIRSTMESDPIVHGRDLFVTTRAGIVTLEGAVPDEFARLRALDIVRQTTGVVQVVDRLWIPPGSLPAGAPRLVPRAVRAALPSPSREPAVAASGRAVGAEVAPELIPVRSGEIDLGPAASVPTTERRSDAEDPRTDFEVSAETGPIAEAPDVSPASPAIDFRAAMSEEDAAISVDVRARVEEVAPSGRIQIVTRHRVVTLSGVVDTDLEKSQALAAARAVRGVERVEDRLLVLRS